MPHITVEALAKGIEGSLTKKERKKIVDNLVEVGTTATVTIVCHIVEGRTGLPTSICIPIARKIAKVLRKRVRERFSQ